MPTVKRIVAGLGESGLFSQPTEREAATFTGRPLATWNEIGLALSIVYPQSTVFLSDIGIGVHQGKKTILRLTTPGYYEDVMPFVRSVRLLTGTHCQPSIPSACRCLYRWAGVQDSPSRGRDEMLMAGLNHDTGYFDCTPGEHRPGVLVDLRSCYYHLMARLPSPIMRVSGPSIWHVPLKGYSAERWNEVIKLVGTNPDAGRIFWGVAIGGCLGSGVKIWRNGVKSRLKLPGMAETAGKVVARLAWEFTREASEETGSVYSQTDCVVIPSDSRGPAVWDRWGLPYRIKAEGHIHVIKRDVYRVGERPTIPFRWQTPGDDLYTGITFNEKGRERKLQPPVVFYRELWKGYGEYATN